MGWKSTVIVLFCFGLYLTLSEEFSLIKYKLDFLTGVGLFSFIIAYFLVGLPLYAGTFLIDRTTFVFTTLGLGKSILEGFVWAVLMVLPMLLSSAACFRWTGFGDWENAIAATLVPGFFEELYFRGFLFGLLFRKSRLGFLTSVLISSLIFGLGHLWQGKDIWESTGVFGITFMGGLLFSWLYAEWKYNLWVPIFLHTFMNLIWLVFEMDATALGGWGANFARALTIAAAIGLTLYIKRKNREVLVVNSKSLWKQTQSSES